MRILLTNDDGINAPGFAVLESIAEQLSDDVWVVAPAEEQSGMGHALTLTRPLRMRQLGERRGRHADLVRHERDHGLGRLVAGTQTPTRVAQEAELHGEPEAVHAAPLGPDKCVVFVAEQIVPCHPGSVDRDGEQAIALFCGQQDTTGHENLVAIGADVQKLLAIRLHSEREY